MAKYAGFCYGVKRAVELSIKIKEEHPDTPVYILGQLIHNNQVIEYLNSLGILTVNEIPEDLEGICIIRTHGVPPQVIEKLETKSCDVINATCPDVKKVQEKAQSLASEGYRVIIIGKPDHPEVIAIKAYADLNSKNKALVISPLDDFEQYKNIIKESKRIGVVIQTTQTRENFKNVLAFIAENAKELKIYNTICNATCNRQAEAIDLARQVQLMVVVGSHSSANTTHLAQILRPIVSTIHIETHEELKNYQPLLDKVEKIGVTAGASTPDFIIDEVVKKLEIGE